MLNRKTVCDGDGTCAGSPPPPLALAFVGQVYNLLIELAHEGIARFADRSGPEYRNPTAVAKVAATLPDVPCVLSLSLSLSRSLALSLSISFSLYNSAFGVARGRGFGKYGLQQSRNPA